MKKHTGILRKLALPQLLGVLLIFFLFGLYLIGNKGPGKEPILTTPAEQNLRLSTTISSGKQVSTINPSAGIATTTSQIDEPTGNFDFFVLALSWSPDYCASNSSNDPQQCSIGKKLGFVLHGLWPQNKHGYPSNCSNEMMPLDVKAEFPSLYPNLNLYDHEWEKHGTCSGLSPQQFLSLSKRLKESVVIPSAFKTLESPIRTTTNKLIKEFTNVNPSYSVASIAVICSGSGRYLKEVYVCFSKEGQPITCSSEVLKTAANTCQRPDFLIRNIR
jgi:ribonuclease T2